ncbi:MAG: sulfotransferase domain-containing protein [Bacteroidota bacterium]
MSSGFQANDKFLFLGGAPKCGTTFLHNLLKDHPQLNPSSIKETYFFIDKEHTGINRHKNFHKNGYEGFGDYFSKQKGRYFLEATSHLMYQQTMFDTIKNLGNVKMILILRNPLKRIVSTFDFTKNNLGNIKDHKDYNFQNYSKILLAKKFEMLEGWLRNENGNYVFRRELDYCCYYPYVKNWVDALGMENVKVIQFEKLIKAKEKYLKEILNWAELDGSVQLEENEKSKNKSFGIKNTWLHHQSIELAKYVPNSRLKNIVKKIYFSLQKQNINREDQLYRIPTEMKKYFEKSNQKLEAEFNFSLEEWQ